MAFSGWPAAAVTFFEGLEADNSKRFFDANREVYLETVKAPMQALLEELEPEFGAPKLFRPNRDIRFSHDKTPYKDNIAATIGTAGYISLSADVLGAGSGLVHMAKDQLERYRAAVDDNKTGSHLQRIVDELNDKGHECGPHEALKTAPRGFSKEHPRIELLKAKGLIAWHHWPVGAWLRKAEAKHRVIEVLRDSRPLGAWLTEHVGPSTLEHQRRD
jgi:uncharacterized protein (TIGR02453 family)